MRQYPFYRIFVAETDGTIAGTYSRVILDKLAKRGARAGVVEDVAVLTAFQGRGIGRAMMEHTREGAHRFYDARGFERHGYGFLMRV